MSRVVHIILLLITSLLNSDCKPQYFNFHNTRQSFSWKFWKFTADPRATLKKKKIVYSGDTVRWMWDPHLGVNVDSIGLETTSKIDCLEKCWASRFRRPNRLRTGRDSPRNGQIYRHKEFIFPNRSLNRAGEYNIGQEAIIYIVKYIFTL